MIAITAATWAELRMVETAMFCREKNSWNGLECIVGTLYGKDTIAVRLGVGKVMAAISTQRLIERFAPDAIIVTGMAGALTDRFDRGQIVAGTETVQHDFDASFFGFKRGEVPDFKDSIIRSDQLLLDLALSCSSVPVQTGRFLSGDQFITNAESSERAYLVKELSGDVVDMETSAVGMAAFLNKIPFLPLKIISDRADGKREGSYVSLLNDSAPQLLAVLECILNGSP